MQRERQVLRPCRSRTPCVAGAAVRTAPAEVQPLDEGRDQRRGGADEREDQRADRRLARARGVPAAVLGAYGELAADDVEDEEAQCGERRDRRGARAAGRERDEG